MAESGFPELFLVQKQTYFLKADHSTSLPTSSRTRISYIKYNELIFKNHIVVTCLNEIPLALFFNDHGYVKKSFLLLYQPLNTSLVGKAFVN